MKPPIDGLNRLDLVGDTYGPGAYLAWVLVAYSTSVNMILEPSPRADSIKYDFLATLIYAVVVAGHLIVQVCRFPGPRREIWNPTDNALIPYTAAIQASTTVCLVALVITFGWTYLVFGAASPGPDSFATKPRRATKRLCLLGTSTIWIFTALYFQSLVDFWLMPLIVTIFALTPMLLCTTLFYLFGFTHGIIDIVQLLMLRLRSLNSLATFTSADFWCLLPVIVYCVPLMITASCSYGALLLWRLWLIPESNYSVGDMSQALALVGGCFNASLVLYKLYKRYVRQMWEYARIGG